MRRRGGRLSAGIAAPVVIPESRVMLAATVAQVASQLSAEWVLEPVNADALIERYLIGGNIMDSGPTYFGRYANQAVIARAQRPDIQMASMGRETRCLVLTGPGDATEYVKAEARERDIPLLRVASSTEDTAAALGGICRAGHRPQPRQSASLRWPASQTRLTRRRRVLAGRRRVRLGHRESQTSS